MMNSGSHTMMPRPLTSTSHRNLLWMQISVHTTDLLNQKMILGMEPSNLCFNKVVAILVRPESHWTRALGSSSKRCVCLLSLHICTVYKGSFKGQFISCMLLQAIYQEIQKKLKKNVISLSGHTYCQYLVNYINRVFLQYWVIMYFFCIPFLLT